MAPRIFVSSRHDDAAGSLGRLRYRLAERFAPELIHFETEQGDEAAERLRQARDAAWSADVILLVVGNSWAMVTDADGNRRLDDPCDPVRCILADALADGRTVLPVLVDQAPKPRTRTLPHELVPLLARDWLSVSHASFGTDVDRLVARLEQVLRRPRTLRVKRRKETSVPVTIAAPAVHAVQSASGRRQAFIASRVTGPFKRERVRRAVFEDTVRLNSVPQRFDPLEWFRVFGPLTIFVSMFAFFAYFAS